MSDTYRLATRAIHAGRDTCGESGAVTTPIYATSTFRHGNSGGYDYTRSGNPNFCDLEAVLAELEGATHATCFASGVAAITAVVSTLKQGDLVIAEENLYGCTFRLFERVFAKFGLEVRYLDLTDEANWREIEHARPCLVWLESPTNPLLKILDIAAISERAHRVDASVLVDNTFCSPVVQRPLELGADLSLSSTTKYINGHSDCLGGVVATHSADWAEKLVFAQKALGLNPSPFDAWLIRRGVKTLAARMRVHAHNALRLAERSASVLGAERVRYPFLASHPGAALARRQMRSGSGILSVDFGLELGTTRRLLERLRLFAFAESLGGVESLVCHPATMTHASVPRAVRESVGITDSLVRFSVGIEACEDLLEDLIPLLEEARHA